MAKSKNDSPADFMPPPARNSFEFGAAADNPAAIPPAKEDKKRTAPDPELRSIKRIQAILDELATDAARCRVMAYLSARHTAAKE